MDKCGDLPQEDLLDGLVPDMIPYLKKGEKVTYVEQVPFYKPNKLLSHKDALCLLTNVDKPEDIGMNGPAVAATSLKENQMQQSGQGLFECLFGRDGLYGAKMLMAEFPNLTRVTLLKYASLIGMHSNTQREEEFGRMFHEFRESDDARAQELTQKYGWEWPYYASVDATPLFVVVLGQYCLSSPERMSFLDETFIARNGSQYKMLDAMHFAITWLMLRIIANREGFVEYKPAFDGSIRNQCMEDSYDSHFHADGILANSKSGITSTEVQGLAYEALVTAAIVYNKYSKNCKRLTSYCIKAAIDLKQSICQNLLLNFDYLGSDYIAVGGDRNKAGEFRPFKVRKAIPAFILGSGIVNRTKTIEQIVTTLFSPAMLATGGIRSLAIGEPRMIPGGYHTGSVWIFQNYEIAQRLRKIGFHHLATDLECRIVKCVEETNMYPEYVRGDQEPTISLNTRIVKTFDPQDGRENKREQPPQKIQYWTLAAYAAIQYKLLMGTENRLRQQFMTAFEEKILSNI